MTSPFDSGVQSFFLLALSGAAKKDVILRWRVSSGDGGRSGGAELGGLLAGSRDALFPIATAVGEGRWFGRGGAQTSAVRGKCEARPNTFAQA